MEQQLGVELDDKLIFYTTFNYTSPTDANNVQSRLKVRRSVLNPGHPLTRCRCALSCRQNRLIFVGTFVCLLAALRLKDLGADEQAVVVLV